MTQTERKRYLINFLRAENPAYSPEADLNSAAGSRSLLRALMNVRAPAPAPKDFLCIQDEYLKEELRAKGITEAPALKPRTALPGGQKLYLWQGDITLLACDAIVNAANSSLTGCYIPNHACIDNCIHTFSGVQLRLECARIMEAQRTEEPTGNAKITMAYNLPCKRVIHTVGPIVTGALTKEHERLLASCYASCLSLASEYNLKSIAFCCISTGVFRFPNERAAEIALSSVKDFFAASPKSAVRSVIFTVFKDEDKTIYERLLSQFE
ncbi:MAG: protein-ADP-ribose hydrolase [Treponema sp.]